MTIPKWIQLYKDKALAGDSGTETFPLKRTDQILELLLKVRAKNGATANAPDAAAMPTPESSLTKIQINSGSAVFKSYSGELCRKIATYRNGVLPPTLHTQAAGGTWAGHQDPALGWMEYTFPINFNVKSDPFGNRTGTMMPAPLYDSLDLVLDYNFTISATAGFVTGGANHAFDLYALVMPKEAPAVMQGKNMLVETKKHDYTTLASGDEQFDLTLDGNRRLRQAFIQCYENGIGEGVDITDVEFKVDNDVYWASKWGDLQDKNAMDCNLRYWIDYYMKCVGTTDELWTRIPAPIPLMHAGTAPTVAPYFTTLGNGDKVTITTDAANDVNLIRIGSNVLPAVAVIDLDQDGAMLNMQSQAVKDLELKLTNGGAGGTVQILEQSIARPWGY